MNMIAVTVVLAFLWSTALSLEAIPGVLVFSSSRSGGGDIYAADAFTQEVRPIIASPHSEGGARYDVLQNRLLHMRYVIDQGFVVAGEKVLAKDDSGGSGPAISPRDGSIVIALEHDGTEDLWIANGFGKTYRRLTDDATIDRYPCWSPDGSKIVFARKEAGRWDLFELDPFSDELKIERLTDRGLYVGHPRYAPDGSRIAFDMMNDGQTDIALLDLESGEVSILIEREGNDLAPAWSLDGSIIAFGGVVPESGDWELWTYELETETLTRVTDSPGFDGGPVWIPGHLVD